MTKKIILIDLESTCCTNDEFSREDMEIIEIGAVAYNLDTKEILDKKSFFIKPTLNPQLTDFCKKLTTITQSDVDNAPLFSDVLKTLQNWIDEHNVNNELIGWGSWGKYDKNQFRKDINRTNKSDKTFLDTLKHFNIKDYFAYENPDYKGKFQLAACADFLNIKFEGQLHRGVDDAYNIAKIVQASNMDFNIDVPDIKAKKFFKKKM